MSAVGEAGAADRKAAVRPYGYGRERGAIETGGEGDTGTLLNDAAGDTRIVGDAVGAAAPRIVGERGRDHGRDQVERSDMEVRIGQRIDFSVGQLDRFRERARDEEAR